VVSTLQGYEQVVTASQDAICRNSPAFDSVIAGACYICGQEFGDGGLAAMSEATLRVHFGESLSGLAVAYRRAIDEGPLEILEAPWVVVPSMALRQWLDQEVASLGGARGGVAANVQSFFPERMVAHLEALTLGSDGGRKEWGVDATTLRVLAKNPSMSFADAKRQAELVDELVRWREDLLDDGGLERFTDRLNETVRQLRIVEDGPQVQRRRVLERLRSGNVDAIPSQVIVFGLSTVPGGRQFLQLLEALSTVTQVDCFVPVPDLDLAKRVLVEGADVLEIEAQLETAWLNESLEALALWREIGGSYSFSEKRRASDPGMSLGRLQARLLGHDAASAAPDQTVDVLGAFGSTRQVEQLRDVLFVAIEDGVEPHEILVATPDVGVFEPALERHWNHRFDEDPRAPRLAYEQTVRAAQRMRNRAGASVALLRAIGNYATLDQISELLAYTCIANGLGLTYDETQVILNRAEEGKLIFGISPEQRAPFDVYPLEGTPNFASDMGTWQRIADRVAATSLYPRPDEGAPVEDLPPLNLLGEAIDLGPLARTQPLLRLLDDTAHLRSQTADDPSGAKCVPEWLDLLRSWMGVVAGATPSEPSFERALAKVTAWFVDDQDLAATLVSFDQFCDLWANVIAERTVSQAFGSMGVLVANMRSLEWAPFETIALVGLDEENLPRPGLRSEVLAERRIGDPDPRRAAVGSFLSEILSAQGRLVISWNARNEQTGEPVAPSLVLQELFDALQATSPVDGGWESNSRDQARRHQFFGDDHPVARRDLRLHQLAEGIVEIELDRDESDDPDLSMRALRSFYRAPVASFLRHGSNLEIPHEIEGSSIRPEVSVTELDLWKLRDALRREVMASASWHEMADHFRSNPPGQISLDGRWLNEQPDVEAAIEEVMGSDDVLGDIPRALWEDRVKREAVVAMAALLAIEQHMDQEVGPDHGLYAPISLGDVGELRLVPDDQELILTERMLPAMGIPLVSWRRYRYVSDSPDAERDLLQDAVLLLALRCAVPEAVATVFIYGLPTEANITSVVEGDPKAMSRRKILSIHPDDLPADDARSLLGSLVEIWREGMAVPLPIFRKTTAEMITKADKAKNAWGTPEAKQRTQKRGKPAGEATEMAHRLLFPYAFEELRRETAFEVFADRLRPCIEPIRNHTYKVGDSDPRYSGSGKSLNTATEPDDLGKFLLKGGS
jgi:exonuclease V gamma subunit